MRFAFLFCLLLAFSATAIAAGVDRVKNRVTLSLTSEPPSLDTSLSSDTTSSFILNLTNEGLVTVGPRGEILPGVAERWDVEPTRLTFHLRADARWSDGVAVTADDFVYAFRRLVDPATAAAGSTFFAYIIRNAEAILKGEMAPDTLGVRAETPRRLVVDLALPAPYALWVLTGTPYMPLRQDFVTSLDGRFGANAEHLLYNGPFVLARWVHNASMVLNRNPDYWNSREIKLDGIDIGYITADTRSLFNLYKSGELAALRLDENVLKDASAAGFRIQKAPTNCLAWLILNMDQERPTKNKKLREAIRLAFDRDRYVNNIVGLPGTEKIDSVFTRRIKGVSSAFQTEHPAPEIPFDIPAARALLAEARAEMGVAELPPLILLANETRQIEAEFIQSQLKMALGLDIRVDKQTFKQSIAKMRSGDFDIARAGFCGGALMDPVFFAGIFSSNSPYNDGGFADAEYDRLMQVTHSTADQSVRMQAFAQLQQILFDEVPIIPTHENAWIYVQDPGVRDFRRFPVTDFSRGFITP
ncbi:MAG: peptide ABC transporter substrate-binding protein [Pseudomonadota bacterium]